MDFHPRPELKQLQRWCQDQTSKHLVRLVTAAGGEGKTRLGLQLCHQLQHNGWIAGLLHSGASLDEVTGDVLAGAIEAGHRVLVVVDYAETFAHDLPTVVATLLRCPADAVRLLLLARNTGRWWDTLAADASWGHLIDPAPHALTAVGGEDLGGRQAGLRGAYRVFSRRILIDQGQDDSDVPGELLVAMTEHPTVLGLHALALNHVLKPAKTSTDGGG